MAKVFGDRWEIVRPLGSGGQGETFLVKDIQGEHPTAALKRLKNINRLARFEREIQSIRSLDDHPHVLRLIAADLESQKPYLVSEYCEKGSLEDNKEEVLSWSRDRRMQVFEETCLALSAAHEAGIVHRDVKPANVFLKTDGVAVLGDFGLCFMDDERLTETVEAVGSRYYMAPELAEGRAKDVSPRSDVYSLGKLLYWLMTGRVFDRERHREGRNHLVNYEMDESVEHLHQLFDRMIVEGPEAGMRTRGRSSATCAESGAF